MSSPRDTEEELTPLDWLGATGAALGTMFCSLFAVYIGPRYQKAFSDFGSEIPALTRLVFVPWFPLLLGLVPGVMVALALVMKTSLGSRRGLVAAALFLSFTASGLCVYAVYLPISEARALLQKFKDEGSPPEPYMKSLIEEGVLRALPFVLVLGALFHFASGTLAW